MPIMLYPVCWRGREDCEPIHCIDGIDPKKSAELTEEDYANFNYTPDSFVCSGCVKQEDRNIQQDMYRLCFKNEETDEMSDNDVHDLTSVVSVAAAALNLDAVRKLNSGTLEIPAEQFKEE